MSTTAGTSKPVTAGGQQGSGGAEGSGRSQDGTAKPKAEPADTPRGKAASPSNRPPPGAYHTITLLQPSKHDSTRLYQDFSCMLDAIDGVLKMFETRLKEYNPGASTINYDYNSLCQYLDDMREICILSWDPITQGYKRYDRNWVKTAVQDHLSNLAAPTGRR